jgi:hypothetical protein
LVAKHLKRSNVCWCCHVILSKPHAPLPKTTPTAMSLAEEPRCHRGQNLKPQLLEESRPKALGKCSRGETAVCELRLGRAPKSSQIPTCILARDCMRLLLFVLDSQKPEVGAFYWTNWAPASVKTLVLALRKVNQDLRALFTAVVSELASTRERMGQFPQLLQSSHQRRPRIEDPQRRKSRIRKRGGQPGHPGSGPELLSIHGVDAVVEQHPDRGRRCGKVLRGRIQIPCANS